MAQIYFNYNASNVISEEQTFHTVTLTNGTLPDGFGSGLYKAGAAVSVTAPATSGANAFSFWQNGAGVSVSNLRDYSFTMGNENITLTAVYQAAAKTLASISVETLPAKTSYHLYETFDASGLTIRAHYSDTTSEVLSSGFTYSPGEFSSAGTIPVTVTYNGVSASFDVTVTDVTAGTILTFGSYEQDNDPANGKEAVEWLVLDVDSVSKKALVISKYALDTQKFHGSQTDVTWAVSNVRAWLNDVFFSAAITEAEQAKIFQTAISTPANPTYGTLGGSDTNDRLFLLSLLEADSYFSGNEDRACSPTPYAKAQGAYCSTA